MTKLSQERDDVEIVYREAGLDLGVLGKIGIGEEMVVADVGEGGVALRADEVAEFGVDGGSEEGLAGDAAEEVLVLLVGLNEGEGKVGGGLKEVGFGEMSAAELEVAGADGDEVKVLGSGRPVEFVFGEGGFEEKEMGGIVVGSHAAVLEEAFHAVLEVVAFFAMNDEAFGWIEGGGGGAGADDLPEGKEEVVARGAGLVVFGGGIVGEGPGGAGGGIAGDGEEVGAQEVGAEKGGVLSFAVLGEEFLEHLGEPTLIELGLVPFPENTFEKHLVPEGEVELKDLGNRHSPREASGDDGSGAGASNGMEVVGKEVGWVAGFLAKLPFHFGENLEREDPANAAAID